MNENKSRLSYLLLACIILVSLPIKFLAAQNMPYDIDIVPVLARNVDYTLTAVGTLSSVAAYNFPMLEWLHLPLQALTGNVWWTIFLTLLIFNILSTFATFCLADSMFDSRAGLAAATLFTFSEVGISSTYTAWAQLLLPGFFVMTVFFLWEWRKQEKGIYLAAVGLIATAAFMTHFSALLLYPAMLAFAVITKAKWQWRWLLVGATASLLMLMPYLLFEIDRDFVDLKAFVTQDVLVAPEVMAEYEIYKSGYRPPQDLSQTENTVPALISSRPEALPRWRRAINYVLSTPDLYLRSFNQAFRITYRGMDNALPTWVASSLRGFNYFPMLFFWLSLLIAAFQLVREIRLVDVSEKKGITRYAPTSRQISKIRSNLVETAIGRVLLLWFFLSVILVLMILTRSINNVTYLMGFSSIQLVMASLIFYLLPKKKWAVLVSVILLTAYASIQTSERFLRLQQHDDSVFSAYNVSIYRHIEAAVDFIAQDWQGDDSLTISYDILPEMSNLWWTGAWNSIDPSYRMGMNFDFLLTYHYGLTNLNTDPIGTAENADYIIIYSPALERYQLENYDIFTFGAIVVLKEKS
jgi:4-amino-4-deoxy-L-arabinose transferase-like glycosyltransferase